MAQLDDQYDIDEVSNPEESANPTADWVELDDLGFKKLERETYEAYLARCVLAHEDDREDKEDWAEAYAESRNLDLHRVKGVTELGIYAGERNDYNERHGRGEARYPNGDFYVGEFQSAHRHGVGKYIHSAASYEATPFVTFIKDSWSTVPEPRDKGSFAQDTAIALRTSAELINLILELVEATGCDFRPTYSGSWSDGAPSGEGVRLFSDGTLCRGSFKDGAPHGHCVVFYPNGDKFFGEFVTGRRNGHGTYVYGLWTWSQAGAAADAAAAARIGSKSGGQLSGEWVEGSLVRGTYVATDGVVFRGEFDSKTRPEGRGALGFPSTGLMLEGVIRNGRWRPEGLPVPADFPLHP